MVETTFQGTPEWYGGAQGILKPLLERARNESLAQYQPYGGERIAQFAPFQEEAFRLASQEANAPYYPQLYEQAQGAIQGGLGQNVSGTIAPYLQRGTASPVENIQQYMNPYQEQVVNNIGRLGSRNLTENILPNVQNRFVGAGQYGSTQQQNLTNRAIRDTQEAVSQAQANALHGGYNTALQTSIGQQGRSLEAGQLAGATAGRDIERQMLGAEALQNLAGTRQAQSLRNVGVLGQLGGQQQQQAQNAANVAYQEFQNQRNYPFFQTARLNEIARGLPVNTQQFASSVSPTPPMAPQASPYTQAGGLLAGATGALGQRYAHGGEVKKLTHHRHYADGGALNPIQQGANTAIDTAELKAMRDQATNLARPQVDPFWASISRAGFNIAANRQPGVLAKLGQAGGEGLNEYQSQLAQQDQRGLQSAKIMNMIDNTRRLQAERNRVHEFEREKFGQHQKEFGMTHDIEKSKLGLLKEKLEYKKGEGKLTSPYEEEYGKTRSKEEAKSDVKRSEGIREKSEGAQQEIQTIDQILGAVDKAKVGPGFNLRNWVANASQALDIGLPEGIDLGDPSAMLEVKKGLTILGMKTAKKFNPNRPTNFDLETALKSLPDVVNSPETLKQVLNTRKAIAQYDAEINDFKNDWEDKYGSIRKKSPSGKSFEKAYDLYADENIWPQLRALNKKYEVNK